MDTFKDNKIEHILNMDVLLNKVNPLSPYGKNQKKEMMIYKPGDENLLIREYNLMDYMEKYYLDKELLNILSHIKDIKESIYRAEIGEVLSIVEFFEIKNFVIYIDKILKRLDKKIDYEEIKIVSLKEILKILDPSDEKLNTFYIYDSYSDNLKIIREEKNEIISKIKEIKKDIRNKLLDEYKIKMNLKNEIHIDKSEYGMIQTLDGDDRLIRIYETSNSLIFTIKNTREIDKLEIIYNDVKAEEELEEFKIMSSLSHKIGREKDKFNHNFKAIGKIDLILSKLREAKITNSKRPQIIKEHIIVIKEGRHLKTEESLIKKSKAYMPISINLNVPTTCITGANMGGKTVTLKMIGQIVLATALGLFVPAEECILGLTNHIYVSIGDEQSIEKGLSTFGAEIQNLAKAFNDVEDRCLILIDELAGGTNPIEGYSITKSVIDYLSDKKSISVITTHFDKASTNKVQRLQVSGLDKINIKKIEDELLKNPEIGIDIIADNMDYRLISGNDIEMVPRDALNIAELMGLQKEIIEQAKNILKGSENIE